MQDRSSEARGRSRVAILLTFVALLSLLIVAFAVPAFAAFTPVAQQGESPDKWCGDAAGAEASPEHCPDPCDDAAAAHGGGDDCDDECDDAAAAHGGGDDCDDECDDAAAAHGGGDDDCGKSCEETLAAAWGGGGHHDDDDCPLPCPDAPPAPTATPDGTSVPAPTATTPGSPTQTPEPTATATEPPEVPTVLAAHGGGGGGHNRGAEFDCETEDEYGRIISLPVETENAAVEAAHSGHGGLKRDDLNGEWVIDDKTYTVSAETILVADHGRFDIFKCVEVTYPVDNPGFALMIESKPDRKCGPPDSSTILWGPVLIIPEDAAQLGVWTVGGEEVVVTAETVINTVKWSDDPIEVGDFVVVKFVDVDGTQIATLIQQIWPHKWGHGWWNWRMGRAFGPIDALPDGAGEGTWEIAGVSYIVNSATRLDDKEGTFAVGVNVKVEFYKLDDGTRIARKIKSTDDRGGGEGSTFRFVGVVDAKPDAFVGDWTIGGAAFVADENTRFDEGKGLLVVGAYVAVKYTITDDLRLASEIKTVVPPGGGGHRHFGRIQRHGTSTMNVAAADGQAQNVWRIGDQEFVITEGTLLNDQLSALEEGQFALVDSYTDTDGTVVATSIEGMAQNYLPMLQGQ